MAREHAYKHKVQYYETDQMGIVHHSNYIRWFEEGRTDYMSTLGMGYHKMEEAHIYCPVLSVEADFLRMVRFGDVVTVNLKIKEYNGFKMTVAYEVVSDTTGMVHCRGTTKHCFLDEKSKPITLKKACEPFHRLFMDTFEDGNKQ